MISAAATSQQLGLDHPKKASKFVQQRLERLMIGAPPLETSVDSARIGENSAAGAAAKIGQQDLRSCLTKIGQSL